MLSWRGIAWHVGVPSLLPAYFAIRTLLNLQYWNGYSAIKIAALVVSWTWYVYTFHVTYFTSPLRHLPNPTARDELITGHEYILRTQVPMTSVILDVMQASPNNGILALYVLFHSGPAIFATTPEAVMEIVSNHSYDWHKPSADRTFLKRILGNGLVTSEDQAHRSMRKSVAPAFAGKHIRDLVPLFYEKGRAFADVVASKTASSTDGSIEVMSQMSRVTLDLIGSAGIGEDFDTIHNDDNYIAHLYELITDPNRGSMVVFFLIMVYLPTFVVERLYGTRYARVANAIRELRIEVRKLVTAKKESRTKTTQKDIIAVIMQSGDFSDDYLVDQMLTFFAAGHDTTASALTWTLYMLSLHPKIQDRLREECKRLVGNRKEMDADLLDKLPYLSAVCNEMLRLYPPVPVTARTAMVDTQITGTRIPKGTLSIVSLWAMGRLPAMWGEDAAEFRPERWLEGEKAAIGGAANSHAFATFLHGPRSCIGQTFARSEMKCLLLAMILRFRFELADPDAEVRVAGFVTIKPADGMRIIFHDLKKETS